MHSLKWSISLIVLAVLCQLTVGLPSYRSKRETDSGLELDLNPNETEDSKSEGLDREKRKLPDAKFGAKNAVLGFVFGDTIEDRIESLRTSRAVVDDGKDTAELSRGMVSLDIPDELFSQSFTTVTNVSKVVARFIMNSARRYSRFALFFKPVFGNALTVKGYNDPTTTTTENSKDNTI